MKTRNPFGILRSIIPGEDINDFNYPFLMSTLILTILKPFFPPSFKPISLFENQELNILKAKDLV